MYDFEMFHIVKYPLCTTLSQDLTISITLDLSSFFRNPINVLQTHQRVTHDDVIMPFCASIQHIYKCPRVCLENIIRKYDIYRTVPAGK